ncbi:MAG: DUF4139 domain-containing protein [Erythrobacter sp.]
MRTITALITMSLAAMPLAAQDDSSAQGDLSVTIYNNDQALIRDVRRVAVPDGTTRIPFPDVSAQIRPETVTLEGDGFIIREQNFDYDLLSPAALMQKAVGQDVTLIRTNPATGIETRERATILAVNGGVVMQIGQRIEVLRDDGLPVRVVFDRIPANLRATPTLSIMLEAERSKTRELALSYLSRGLSWSADYVALFNEPESEIDVQGWITLTNNTGTTFEDARTLLVAGSVGSVQEGYNRYDQRRNSRATRRMDPGTESADRERLGDFYIYPLDERTTIANAQQKQVSFLDVSGAGAENGYEFVNQWLGGFDEAPSVSSVIRFSTSRDGGLGDALPAGTVRVYQRDRRGNAQFIGESGIGHTPGGSQLSLITGEAFDVKIQPLVVDRSRISSNEWEQSRRYRITRSDGSSQTVTVDRNRIYYRTEMRYTLTNAGDRPVTVVVAQKGLDRGYWSDTRVPSESIEGEQRDADTRVWEVPVPANGTTVLTATFDTAY